MSVETAFGDILGSFKALKIVGHCFYRRRAQQLGELTCPSAEDKGKMLVRMLQRLAPQEEAVVNAAIQLSQVTTCPTVETTGKQVKLLMLCSIMLWTVALIVNGAVAICISMHSLQKGSHCCLDYLKCRLMKDSCKKMLQHSLQYIMHSDVLSGMSQNRLMLPYMQDK